MWTKENFFERAGKHNLLEVNIKVIKDPWYCKAASIFLDENMDPWFPLS